jgi:hypothetical protein
MRIEHDPVKIHGARLEAPVKAAIEESIEEQILAAFNQALLDPYPI